MQTRTVRVIFFVCIFVLIGNKAVHAELLLPQRKHSIQQPNIFEDLHTLRITPYQFTEPEPYSADEFPLWLRDLGRFEAVFIGSIPVALFFTAIAYDLYRLSAESIAANSLQSGYIPGIVNSNHIPFTQKEQELLIGIGIAGAAAIAITDILIHVLRRAKKSK